MKLSRNQQIFILLGMAGLIVLGLIVFMFHRQQIFSKDVLQLAIKGPQQAAMGQEIEYTVTYKNTGNFALENPKLEFRLPDNSLTEDNKLFIQQELNNVGPGDEGSVAFKVRLLGKEGDNKTAQARLSYTPHNLSARYESDATISTQINEVPFNVTYDLPFHVAAGSQLDYAVHYHSDVDYPLEHMSLKIGPVSGFTVTSSIPSSLDKVEWKLTVVNKSQEGQVAVRGKVSPNAPATLVFPIKLGMWQDGVFVVVKEATQSVEVDNSQGGVVQPSVHVQIAQQANQVSVIGQAITYSVTWQCSSDAAVRNVVVKASLPSNVTIGDNVVPDSEINNVAFDGASRQITWSPGSLNAGSNVALTFQITLTPTPDQKGTVAQLVSTATVMAQDQATGTVIQSSAPALNASVASY